MRGRLFRVLSASFVLFVIVEIGSCQLYDTFSSPSTAKGLLRREVKSANGFTVSYLAAPATAPSLPRLIYVHGTPGDASAFDNYLTNPMPGFESLSIDRPGFGLTRPRRVVTSLAEQAKCIEPLLPPTGNPGAILVGHSLGGPIVVEAALDFPDRVAGVVVLAGALDPSLETVAWYQHLAQFAIIPYMIPGDLRRANEEVLPLKAELQALRPRLKDLRCPIVIVHAPNDMLVPSANVEYMLREFPKATVINVERPAGKNHFIPWNAEDVVRRAIETIATAAYGGQQH